MTRRRRTCCDEHGVATIWGLAWIVVCTTIAAVIALGAATVARQHRVDAAADLAAVAGATAVQDGDDACSAAREVAERNHARLSDCTVEGEDVVVETSAYVGLPAGLQVSLEGRARAGPERDGGS